MLAQSVIFVVPGFSRGGAQMHVARQANGLARRGYRVCIISIGPSIAMSTELDDEVTLTSLNGRTSSVFTAWRFLRFVAEWRPDILIGWSVYANFFAALASVFGVAAGTVLVENNYPPALLADMSPLRRRTVAYFVKFLYRFGTVLAGNSHEICRYLEGIGGPSALYGRIYNPVDVDGLSSLADSAPRLPGRNDGIVILASGRMVSRQKGFDVLLHACARLQLPRHLWTLWMLGDGDDLASLKALATELGLDERVRWWGMQTNPFGFYRASDIVALPSRFEGFPNVLLEAMALGKATVSSDCHTGPRELTCDGEYGLLTPINDAAALAAALDSLLSNPEQRAQLGRAAEIHVRATHDHVKCGNEFETLIQMAWSNRHRRR